MPIDGEERGVCEATTRKGQNPGRRAATRARVRQPHQLQGGIRRVLRPPGCRSTKARSGDGQRFEPVDLVVLPGAGIEPCDRDVLTTCLRRVATMASSISIGTTLPVHVREPVEVAPMSLERNDIRFRGPRWGHGRCGAGSAAFYWVICDSSAPSPRTGN
jgi:hypothetical protein